MSQLEAMDVEGLDVAVLFRTFPLHCDDSLEPEYANDLCRAWNNWMADFCKADPKRLRPSALITLRDLDLAIDETRRAITELGAIGLCLVPDPEWPPHPRSSTIRFGAKRKGLVCRSVHPAANPNTDSGSSLQGPRQRGGVDQCLSQSNRADAGSGKFLRRWCP